MHSSISELTRLQEHPPRSRTLFLLLMYLIEGVVEGVDESNVHSVEGAAFVRGREHDDEYAKCVWCGVVFVWLDERSGASTTK
jgi:hypothetical protein